MQTSIKILHLIGQMERGGAERQLLYLTDSLSKKGWQQAVVSFSPGEPWDSEVTNAGIPFFGVQRHSNKLWRLLHFTRIVSQERPTIIHSWSIHTNPYAQLRLGSFKSRLVFSLRGNPAVDNEGLPIRQVPHARTFKRADCVVSNSRSSLKSACLVGMKMRRCEVVDNIVVARGRAKPGETVKVPRIIAAGALKPLKAYDILLEGLQRVASAGFAFELLLVGDGPQKSYLENLARQLGIDGCVSFLGAVDDVPKLMASAHLAVHTSRSEGLSNTILEALAEGLPVVATDVGGTSEIISHGQNGLLVAPDDPTSLALRIRELLESPSLRERLGSLGLRMVREKCNVNTVTAQYERIYESVMSPTMSALQH